MEEKETVLTETPIKTIQCFNPKGEKITIQLTGKETIREAIEIIANSCSSEGVQELSDAIELGMKRVKRA